MVFEFGQGQFGNWCFWGREGELDDLLRLVIKDCCIILFFISSVDVGQHSSGVLTECEVRIFLKETDKASFLVADNFFPEVVTLLIALAGGGCMDSHCMILLMKLETKH